MALHPNYAEIGDIKGVLGIHDTDDDVEIGWSVSAASRMVDAYTRRQFGKESSDSTRRYLVTGTTVILDDIEPSEVTSISVVQGDTTTALVVDDDYTLGPASASWRGRPYTHVELAGRYTGKTYLEVVGTFGWTAVPDEVKLATVIQAIRLFKRKDAPFGVAGSPETGSEMRLLSKLDPDVELLLRPLRRTWAAV